MIKKIVSGGQTGVDRAALDAAIELHIPHGGWCPKGRLSEAGIIPAKYLLEETATSEYSERTKLNIKDSDATLVVLPDKVTKITDGTILTIDGARKTKKPHMIVYSSEAIDVDSIIKWIAENKIKVLNIAGPRESQSPSIYDLSLTFLKEMFICLSTRQEHLMQFKS